MRQKRIAAVVIAAGYGSLRTVDESSLPLPKILEPVAGKPMVLRVLETVQKAGCSPWVVVVNRYSALSVSIVLNRAPTPYYVVQEDRTGAADAALGAVPWLQEQEVDDFLAIYGDMPLWSPETIERLLCAHRAAASTLSMVTVTRSSEYPEFDRYGRVIRDTEGNIRRIVEPAEATREELDAKSVNPSLWIWRREWFVDHAPHVARTPRADGRASERYLPPLVERVYHCGEKIVEVPLSRTQEALGVNTLSELHRVQEIASQHTRS